MPDYKTIIYETRDRTACIILNRPEQLNAISDEMIAELEEAYLDAETDPAIWTLIITGNGRALCAGADLHRATTDEQQAVPGIDIQGESTLATYRQWDIPQEATPPYMTATKPIICAVNGIVAGAGMDFLTTSDIVIASTEATMFDPHVSIGVASAREAVRLARVLPLPIVMRIALMGRHERIGAQRLYDLGLFTELVEPDQLRERAWEIADIVNRNAPLATRGTRLGIRKGLSLPIYEAELLAENYRMKTALTEDAQEGPRAFLEKRPPKWQAR
jgi:enoyl-CoA hydratase/carnithine racemase